jgi:hypothetical protein
VLIGLGNASVDCDDFSRAVLVGIDMNPPLIEGLLLGGNIFAGVFV